MSVKTLIQRALHGLAADATNAGPAQQAILATAVAKVDAAPATETKPILASFADAIVALHRMPGGPPKDSILRTALSGMLDGLDAQTRFIPETQAPRVAGEGSVGLVMTRSATGALVRRVFGGSPAAQAGVRRGDALLSIDGQSVRDVPFAQVASLLRGPVGSNATLVVRHEAASAPLTLMLTRAIVKRAVVYGQAIEGVAYIRVDALNTGAGEGLARTLSALRSQSAAPFRGLVLDLRDDGGGRLDEAVAIADELLPPGTPIATTTGRRAEDDHRFVSAKGDVAAGLLLVVLVNDLTAAGAEIVAAALLDGRGAVLMGGHTEGAGLIATEIPLPPLGTLRLTTERLMLSSGRALAPPGLLPQVALMPMRAEGPDAAPREAPSSDPTILRLRRGIPQAPQSGEPFDDFDAPERDFEVKQACAAILLLSTPRP